jgi:hypothetical protein
MARKTETREIDGLTFEVTQLPGTRCNELSIRLSAILAPALSKAGTALGGVDMAAGLNGRVDVGVLVAGIGGGLEALLVQLKPAEYKWLSKELCTFARVDEGQGMLPMTDGVIDEVFSGKSGTFFKFLLFAVEVNLQNFGAALADLFRQAMVRASLSRSTSAPVGQPGGL